MYILIIKIIVFEKDKEGWGRGEFFQGGRGCNFHIKNTLKSEILKHLMTKKIAQIFFSVITKNSNWEILTKNLVNC